MTDPVSGMAALDGRLTRRAIALASILLLLLSACASLQGKRARPEGEPGGIDEKSGQSIGAPGGSEIAKRYWRFDGKLGVRSRRGSTHLQIHWQQEGDRYRILLTTPFGQTVARIEGGESSPGSASGSWITIEIEGEEPVHGAGAEALTEALLGWRLPAASIPFWLRGEPAPGTPFEAARMPDGRLLRLTQSGWRVRYDEYRSAPTRIRFAREDVELRLVVKSWTPGPEIE